MAIEPLGGKQFVRITEKRTKTDWVDFVRYLIDECNPIAERIALVMDNLNTHDISSFYKAFKPEATLGLKEKLEIHYAAKYGNWLIIAEIELSVLKRQCLAGKNTEIRGIIGLIGKSLPKMIRLSLSNFIWLLNRKIKSYGILVLFGVTREGT